MCLPTTTQLIVQPGDQLTFSSWLTGSAFLVDVAQRQCYQEIFCLAEPNSDPELQSEITICVTSLTHNKLSSTHFERFSTWSTFWRLFLCWNTLQSCPARCLRITPVMDGASVKCKTSPPGELLQLKHALNKRICKKMELPVDFKPKLWIYSTYMCLV